MKLGAEPKKVIILGVLLAIAAISAYMNLVPSTPDRPRQTAGKAASAKPAPLPSTAQQGQQSTSAAPRGGVVRRGAAGSNQGRSGDFRPVFRPERGDAQLDPAKVDPGLHTEILAKLREVRLRNPGRNLFQFGEAPAPPRPPEPKIIPKPLGPDGRPIGEGPPAPPPTPVKPPPPQIPLRYYGFADPKQSTDKRAFFMAGEDIRIAAEGELIRDRYKVIQLGPKSAVVEDVQHSNRQTLAIQTESGS